MANEDTGGGTAWQFDALDLRPVERWLAAVSADPVDADDHTAVAALAHPPQRLIDSYLDTTDWRMARAGFVVRTRRHGRQHDITLKSRRSAEGGQRSPLDASEVIPGLGVAALGSNGPVGRRIHAVAGRHSLGPVLDVRTRRQSFSISVDGVDAARISLDDTAIVVGNGQRPMQLRRVGIVGQPEWLAVVAPLVGDLRAACGLRPASLSKFEAGLLARGVVIPGPPDLGDTGIRPDASMGELAFAVVRRQLATLRDKEPGTRLGMDPEELHDMRVATRRLRAALDLFAGVLPIRARHFRDELGWAASVLGAGRDLDVQLETHGVMSESAEQSLWAELTALLESERDAAQIELLAALDSARWERLVSGLSSMAAQGPFRRSTATRAPAQIALPDLIAARHGAVLKAARRARRSGEAADFHRLRIRCKRLRYSLQFSAELYGHRTRRYTRQLAKLQNQLGLLQDAEVAAIHLSELAMRETGLPATTVFVMGGVAEQHRREMARILQRLPTELRRLRGPEWQDMITTIERSRDQALALVPPARRTLRVVPEPSGQVEGAEVGLSPVTTPMGPDVIRAAGGGNGGS